MIPPLKKDTNNTWFQFQWHQINALQIYFLVKKCNINSLRLMDWTDDMAAATMPPGQSDRGHGWFTVGSPWQHPLTLAKVVS